MKKIILTLTACLVFGALAVGSTNSSNEGSNNKVDAANSKVEAKDVKSYIGDTVEVGNFSVLISELSTKKSIGNEFLEQTANGIYWMVPVSIRNDDKKARTVDSNMFELVSPDGAKYSPDPTAGMYLDQKNNFFLQSINPGIQVDGYLVFDMPKDQQASKYTLKVSGGVGFASTKPVSILLTKAQK